MKDKLKKAFWTFVSVAVAYWPITLGIVAAIALGIFLYSMFSTSESENEKQASNSQVEAVGKQAEVKITEGEVNRQKPAAEAAEKDSASKKKKADAARNSNVKGTSVETANKERCRAYPGDGGCG